MVICHLKVKCLRKRKQTIIIDWLCSKVERIYLIVIHCRLQKKAPETSKKRRRSLHNYNDWQSQVWHAKPVQTPGDHNSLWRWFRRYNHDSKWLLQVMVRKLGQEVWGHAANEEGWRWPSRMDQQLAHVDQTRHNSLSGTCSILCRAGRTQSFVGH